LNQEHTTISVEAEATHLPTGFEVSIQGLAIGSQVTAADIPLPAGTSLITDPEAVVAIIAESPTAEQMEGEVAEAAAELGVVEQRPEAPAEAAPAE
jgi:large subunit ribosomal protein L25